MVALAFLSWASISVTFSALFVFEVPAFCISRSHQFLWYALSFCSAMSRKIIFRIMVLV